MFEKEAEKWAENNLHGTEEDYVKAFKDGAEFGYNKGYHDAEEHYMDVIDSQHKLVDESKKKNNTYQCGFKDGYNKAMEEWKKHFMQCSSPFCLDKFSEVRCCGELGNMSKKEG